MSSQGRYSRHELPQRPGAARPPRMHLVDLRKHPSDQGLSQPAHAAPSSGICKSGGQVIVFLNRRGYAPTLFCNACGWSRLCAHCDARMTLHRRAARAALPSLRRARRRCPRVCASCGQPLHPGGPGNRARRGDAWRGCSRTRRSRASIATRRVRAAPCRRCSSGCIGGEARILVGTQMLTKGHHFPDVSLVVILDADQGLFASDFRATERLAQTITQVAGRAGRAARPGEVIVQTSFPEHPLLTRLDRGRLRALRGRPRSRSGARRAGRRTRGSRCCAPRRRTAERLGRLPAGRRRAAREPIGERASACWVPRRP